MAETEARRRRLRDRAVPNRWTLLLGAVSAACLAVLCATGVLLLFFYDPSSTTVVYHGSYAPLRGVRMSGALSSTLHLSFEVRGGLLVRQAHHWAALVLPGSLMIHMLSVFFTGGFRRPRRLGWLLLSGVFLVVLAGGWSGYALPDDALSGTGLRIVEGITIGLPVVGTRVTSLLFGGEFPGQVVAHLYWLHVLVVPLVLVVLIAARLRLIAKQGSAQPAGPGRTEDNVVGLRLPAAAVRAAGMFVITVGVLFVLAGTLVVAPVWLYGPSSPASASAGSQPDWYTGFLDGALRLVPPDWEVQWLGGTWPLAVLVPLVVVGLFVTLIVVFPFIEERVTGDRRAHHLLDRPREAPNRTGCGVAGLTLYATLWAAAGSDVIATQLHLAFETEVAFLRVALVAGPPLAFVVTRSICLALQAQDRDVARHGVATGTVVRRPDGGYVGLRTTAPADSRPELSAAEREAV